jgi:hypothetical protein
VSRRFGIYSAPFVLGKMRREAEDKQLKDIKNVLEDEELLSDDFTSACGTDKRGQILHWPLPRGQTHGSTNLSQNSSGDDQSHFNAGTS